MLHVLIYKTDSVLVILCGCEIWCLMSRKEHRLRVCEGRVVRRIFDVRGGVGTEGCRRLHSFMSHPSLDIINIVHNVTCKVIQSLLRKPEQEEPRW